MSAAHTFAVVIGAKGHGVGGQVTATLDKAVHYLGEKIEAKFLKLAPDCYARRSSGSVRRSSF